MLRVFLSLFCMIGGIGAAFAGPSGRFLALDPIAPAQEDLLAHVLHLEFEDGWINVAFARADQPEKAQCDANGPCWWDIHPLAVFADEDADGRLSVDQVLHHRSRAVISRARDFAEIVAPIVEFLDGATFSRTDDGAILTNGQKSVDLIRMEYSDAKRALMISQLAEPNDREMMNCYARQLASISERPMPSEAERQMLSVATMAGTMGELSAQPTYWQNAAPDDEKTVRQVSLRVQLMGVIGGMVFSPGDANETAEDLLDRVLDNEVVSNTLELDGLILSRNFVEQNGAAIVALRRYAQWLRTVPQSELRQRLCRSILPD